MKVLRVLTTVRDNIWFSYNLLVTFCRKEALSKEFLGLFVQNLKSASVWTPG